MQYALDKCNDFDSTLLFWITRFVRYKLTTLSNKSVIDKNRIYLLSESLNRGVKNIDELEKICKEARNAGLIGIATYSNPLLKLHPFLCSLGFVSMREIDEECLTDFLMIDSCGLSPASKKNYRIALIGLFGYIEKQNNNGHSFNIHLKNIRVLKSKSSKKLPAYMNESEIQRFLKCVDEFRQSEKIRARNRLIIKLIVYTGMRVNEALTLRLKDIFQEGDFYLFKIRGKGDKMRTSMVKRIHIECLFEEWMEKREELGISSDLLVCNQRGNALTQSYIYSIIDQMLSHCGIFKDKMGAHMLRHSFATLLYQKKHDLILVQEALGHADINTSRIYTHFDKSRLMEMASVID